MKNVPLFLTALLVMAFSFFTNAQAGPPPCGIQAYPYNYSLNQDGNNTTVNFTDTSSAAQGWQIDYWIWNFGDGSPDIAAGSTTIHSYLQGGTYTVCLVVIATTNNNDFCADTICQQINLPQAPPPPTCHDSFTYQLGQTPGALQFTSFSGPDTVATYSWSFGDGSNSSLKNPSHIYINGGMYYACLRIQTSTGCVSYYCDSINAPANPCSTTSAYWYYNQPGNGMVQFTAYDTATGATHHDWSFGDGSAEGFGADPTHTYPNNGTYHVCQYVYVEGNGGVLCNDSLCRDVVVTDTNNCSGFSVSISDILDPQPPGQILEAHVTGDSPNSVIYKWSTGSTSTSISISQSGNYCVTATSGNCTAHDCDSVHIATCTANFTYQILPAFGNVQFTNTSTAPDSIISYSWFFGDNSSSADKNPLHVFANPGNYYVCLRTQTITGCVNYHCDSVYISSLGNPCTGFTANWTYRPGTNGSVSFSAVDTANGATHHDWNFGDGTFGFGSAPSHTYTASGYYRVCQYVYVEANNGLPCSDSSCEYIQVTVPNSCVGFSVSISDIIDPNAQGQTLTAVVAGSSATGATYKWSNGATSASIAVTASGRYCVTATNANNCTATSCDSVIISGTNPCSGLNAYWLYTVTGGSVRFSSTDTASGSTHHIWNFGDNTSSTDVSPTHTYTTSNTYHVCLYVYVVGQTCVDSFCRDVVVNVGNPCADIQANFTYTVSGQTIYLKSSGTYPISAEYQWSLDGRKSSIGAYTTYYFTNASYGQHTVCLYVYSGNTTATPCDSICSSINVANPCSALTALWTSSVLQNGAIHFTPADTASNINHAWSFGDGTTSGNEDPIHTYASSGNYRVCLYVYTPGTTCVDSSCEEIQVTVTTSCVGFSAYIQDIPDTFGTGHTLIAHSASVGAGSPATTYVWSVNDQTGSSIHVTQTGVYCVTATSANCTAVACDSVRSNPGNCIAYFSYTASNTVNGFAFTDLSVTSNPIIAWDWSFGDGSSSTAHNPTHNYTTDGNYLVCLTITTSTGCTATRCDSLKIKPCTGLSAEWTPTYVSNGGVQFNGVTGTVAVYNIWIFGDGTTSTTAIPIHYYSQPGLYDVCHIVLLPGSACADTSCHSVQAGSSASCHAAFTYLTSVLNGSTIEFYDASTSNDSIVSWYWTFGDGHTGTTVNPLHSYADQDSAYHVCLTITTAHGCTATYCDSVRVGGSLGNCTASFRWHAISCLTVEFANSSAAGFIYESWNFGDGSSDTTASPHHTYTQPGVYTVILNVYYSSCYAADTQLITLPTCGVNDTICGTVFGDANNNGLGDNSENGIAGVQVNIGNVSTITDSNGAYFVIVPPGSYYISIVTPAGCIPTLPLNNYGGAIVNGYYINGNGGGTFCGYNFGVNCNIVHICGTVFFDSNNDGTQDSTEAGVPNVHLLIIDSSGAVHNAYTNQQGDYCETLPAGLYTITVVSNYPPGTVTPSYIPVDATTGGTTYGNNNFAIYVPAGSCDLSVTVTPRSCVSPGFPAWYSIEVCNTGTNSTGGTVDMYYDPVLSFNYAYPAPVSQNSSTYTVSWPVNNLSPGQCAYYWVAFKADAPLQIGQPVLDYASVNTSGCTDVNLANNVDTVTQIVRGSWDPNNKQVNPAGEGSEGLINGTEELTYAINFQNTGSAAAVNVVVQDVIPSYLDISTFRIISSNPPFTSMQFNGNQVTWKFSNVQLPDSAADETGSHGYVSFAVTPVNGLPQGTQIMNTGSIYFDYNSGMTTQSTLNTIDYALAVKDLSNNNITITLQPNPFSDFTTVKIDGEAASYELRVYDMLGNQISDQYTESNIFRIERGNMAPGVYVYQVVQQNKVIGIGKMVAQ